MASEVIGVVVGLRAEARIARRLGWPVAIGGGTAAGAEAAARELVGMGATALVSFGLAGGLDPKLRPGAVLVPSGFVSGGALHLADRDLAERLGGTDGRLLLGGGVVAATAAGKLRLYRETGAAAVDLESGGVIRVAAERGLRFAALRAICDPAERDLPPAALAALDGRGAIRLLRVLGSLAIRPGQLAALLALARDAAAARAALVRRVQAIAEGATSLRNPLSRAGEGLPSPSPPCGRGPG